MAIVIKKGKITHTKKRKKCKVADCPLKVKPQQGKTRYEHCVRHL